MLVSNLDFKWKNFIDEASINRIDDSPFLVRCRNGSVTLEELKEFTVQQHFYSKHFTRYLCALLSNMTNEEDRLELTENLLEEIGFGDDSGLPHAKIYRNMMADLNVDPADYTVHPATQALSDKMFEACKNPNPLVGLAALCLGAEAIVPHIYNQIYKAFLAHGEPAENLEFFRIHIEGDDDHAVTMLKIIEKELKREPLQRAILELTARRMLEARWMFFMAISKKKHTRTLKMPGGIFYEQVLV